MERVTCFYYVTCIAEGVDLLKITMDVVKSVLHLREKPSVSNVKV